MNASFEWTKAAARKPAAPGWGWPIVKHIAQVHHAPVELDSVEGQGTTITVHFPNNMVYIFI